MTNPAETGEPDTWVYAVHSSHGAVPQGHWFDEAAAGRHAEAIGGVVTRTAIVRDHRRKHAVDTNRG